MNTAVHGPCVKTRTQISYLQAIKQSLLFQTHCLLHNFDVT